MLNVHGNHKASLGRGEGRNGGRGGGGGGGRRRLYTYRYTVTTDQNDTCITMGSDESHLNVSLIVSEKVTRQCLQITTSFEKKGETKQIRTDVPLLTSGLTNTTRPNRLTAPEQIHCALCSHVRLYYVCIPHIASFEYPPKWLKRFSN